jgi:carboxylesterase type B
MNNETIIRGSCHGDDLFYMFSNDFIKKPEENSKELQLIERFVEIITNYATSGNPGFGWTAIESRDDLKCFDLGNDELKMIKMPELKRMKVWNEIYEEAEIELV